MLVLSRTIGEAIVFPLPEGDVTVTVVDVRGDDVKISVDAPRSVKILRSELVEPANPGA